VNYDDPIIIIEAARAEKIDLAMDMAGSLAGIYINGESVVALAETNWSHGGDKIIVQKGHSIDEYRTQPIGIFLNQPSCLYFLHRYLEPRRLSLSDFRIVEIHPPDLTAQFIAGRIPVIVNYNPWATLAIKDGNGIALADSSQFPGGIPECLWGYRKQLETIPDQDIKKILAGWLQAVEWILEPENRDAYFTILNAKTFHDLHDYTKEELTNMIDGVKIHTRRELIERNRTGGGLDIYLTRLKAFLAQTGRLDRRFKNSDIFDNQWIMGVLTETGSAP